MRLRTVNAYALAAFAILAAAPQAHASFPGKNGLIAYSAIREAGEPKAIYAMAPNGKRVRRLTKKGSPENPTWSPDGRLIAFDRAPRGGGDGRRLYVMKRNGRKQRAVRMGAVDAHNPAWAPNGKRLVFQGCGREIGCEDDSIFVVRRNGRGLKRIAAEGREPVWSPNGRWIAYGGKFGDGECDTLGLVKPSGKRGHAVVPGERGPDGSCPGASGMDFSPDSRLLVYLALRARQTGSFPNPIDGEMHPLYTYDHAMYVVDVNGGRPSLVMSRAIAEYGYLVPPFAWAPEGDDLLWRDDRGTFIGRPQRHARRIADDKGGGGGYSWQPLPQRKNRRR